MSDTHPVSKSQRIRKWATSAITTLLMLVALEFFFGWQSSVHRRAKGFQLAPEFGWTTTENTLVTINKPGYGEVTFSTSQDGFRRYGDVNATRPKILVIGDSYTYADTVSDGEAYFDRLGEKLDVEVFAFGCNGFGTLQELLVLKKHFQHISPDLVVWQLCDNDFVNNSYELESRDLLQSNFMVRPYRVGERVEMRFPSLSGGWLLRRSHLARWAFRRFFARGRQQFDYGNEQNKELASQAFELTAGLLKEGKTHIGEIPMLVFSNRLGGLYQNALSKVDCHFTLAVEQAIESANGLGKKVDARPRDLHWNATGHEIVAATLARQIQEAQLLTR